MYISTDNEGVNGVGSIASGIILIVSSRLNLTGPYLIVSDGSLLLWLSSPLRGHTKQPGLSKAKEERE